MANYVNQRIWLKNFYIITPRKNFLFQLIVDNDIELDCHARIVFSYFLLAAVPRLCSDVRIFVLGKAQEDFLRLLAFTLGHTDDIFKVFVEVDMGLAVWHVGEFHAENPIEWIVAQVSIVSIATEEKPTVVVLLEIVGMDDEGLRLLHFETLIAELHSGLLADGIEERREVLHTFIVDGRLEADGGPHLLVVVHAEVETCAKFRYPVGLRHAVEAAEDVQCLTEMQDVVLTELGGEDGEVGVLVLVGGLPSVLLADDVGVILVLNIE